MRAFEIFDKWEEQCAHLLSEQRYDEILTATEDCLKDFPVNVTESDEAFHMMEAIATILFEQNKYREGLEWCERLFEADFNQIGRFDNGHREYLYAVGLYEVGDLEAAFKNFCISYEKSSGRCFRLPFYPHIDPKKYLEFHRSQLRHVS